MKLNIIPLSVCSAMWQCAIHKPGFVTSSRMSTVWPARTSTVSFQTRLASGYAVPRENEETARAVDVKWVVHRMIRFHFIDQSDLYPVADIEGPGDGSVFGTGLPIDQLPDHVAGVRCTVDIRASGPPTRDRLLTRAAPCVELCGADTEVASESDGTSFIPHFGHVIGSRGRDLGVHGTGVQLGPNGILPVQQRHQRREPEHLVGRALPCRVQCVDARR